MFLCEYLRILVVQILTLCEHIIGSHEMLGVQLHPTRVHLCNLISFHVAREEIDNT